MLRIASWVLCSVWAACCLCGGVSGWSYVSGNGEVDPSAWGTYYRYCVHAPPSSYQSPIAIPPFGSHVDFQLDVAEESKNSTQGPPFSILGDVPGLVRFAFARGGGTQVVIAARGSASGAPLAFAGTPLSLETVLVHYGVEHIVAGAASPSVEVQYMLHSVSSRKLLAILVEQYEFGAEYATDNPFLHVVAMSASALSQGARWISSATFADYGAQDRWSTYTLFPLASANEQSTNGCLPYVLYNGSLTVPPCTPDVAVLVRSGSKTASSSVLAALQTLAATPAVRPLQPPSNRTALFCCVAVPVPTATATETAAPATTVVTSNVVNDRLRIAIISLVSVCCGVCGYIVLLLLARFEYVDIPTGLGGLKKAPQAWVNPPSAQPPAPSANVSMQEDKCGQSTQEK